MDGADFLEQLFVGDALRLGKDGGEVVVVAWLHTGNLAGIHIFLVLQIDRVVDRRKRLVVEHLGALHHQVLGTHLQVFFSCLQFLHSHHRLTTLSHGEEVDHGRCLELVVVKGFHRHLRKECQSAFRTHHRVGHDVERVVVGEKRTQVQTGNVLDTVFQCDAVGQLLVGPHAVAQCLDLGDELGMTLPEIFLALLVASVNNRSVGEDKARAHHHAVAVGMHATVHARGVVDHDAAYHRTAYRGRVGREHTAVGLEDLVHPGTHNARLHLDGILVGP